MADIESGPATCRVKMHRADVRYTEVRCEELEGAYYKVEAVLAPNTVIAGRDLGGWTFTVPTNTFRFVERYASFTLTTARPIALTGPSGETVEVDGWALTSAIKRQRESGGPAAASRGGALSDAFRKNEEDLLRAATAITESVKRDRALPARPGKPEARPARARRFEPRARPAAAERAAEAAAPPAPSPAPAPPTSAAAAPAAPQARSPRAAALAAASFMDARKAKPVGPARARPAAPKHMAGPPAPRGGEDAAERERLVDGVMDGTCAEEMERGGVRAAKEESAPLSADEKTRRDGFMTALENLMTTPRRGAGTPRAVRAPRPARAAESDSGSARVAPAPRPAGSGKPARAAGLDPDLFPVLGIDDLDDQIESASESERAARASAAAQR